jgi:hypothetical protein
LAFWNGAIATGILSILSLISAALYYWNITAYLLLLPLLPPLLLRETTAIAASPASHTRLIWSGQVYGLLFAGLLVVHSCLLPISALFSSKSEVDPDSRMGFGWDGVAVVVNSQTADLGDHPFLLTTDYRSSSALAYQLQDKHVLTISDRIDQFDFWYPSDCPFKGRNAVILGDDWHPISRELLSQFQAVSEPVRIPVTRFGVWIKNYYLVKGYQFKGGRVS